MSTFVTLEGIHEEIDALETRIENVISQLMLVAEHEGPVSGLITHSIEDLRECVGLPPLEGTFTEGWTESDWADLDRDSLTEEER